MVESAAIANYFARLSGNALGGKDAFEIAQVDQFVNFGISTLMPHFPTIYQAIFGVGSVEADAFNNAMKEFKDAIRLINTHLQGKDYLVGDRLTVADIFIAMSVIIPFQVVIDAGVRKSVVPNVTAWLERFIALPEVVRRIGHVKLCAKALKPVTAPKKEEKKEEKKVEKPVAEAAPKKEVDPLDALPETKFNLYDFKTYFVNLADKKGEGMKFFFENYDPEGYSIYYAKYEKYEGEGDLLYKTANLMNGFIQRVDEKFRRHAFAAFAIVGEEPNLDIESLWLWRGKGIPAQMIEHPQFEYYQKRELDVNNEADKALIADFFCGSSTQETINGNKLQEFKLYK